MDHYDKIIKQLIFMLHDPYMAEEIAQEVFIRLYEHPPKDEEHMGAWLYQVAKNMALNRIRSDKSRMARESKAWALEGLPAYSPFELKEEVMYAREVLSKMEERDRTILIMKHSGCSYDEIAQTIRVKKTSVGTLIARAQKKFKQMYEEV
ncbi:RNA polymerase subunit sigma [Thermoanaerobacteraceae bacterium SP2]|nr:RNA polymerase subunit sigma [Thermoanaerobacteraceae bacterium SP2]